MKIFEPTNEISNRSESVAKKKGPAARKHAALPEKKDVSDQEIREKLAAHVETSNTGKAIAQKKNTQKLGEGFLNSDVVPVKIERPVEASEDGEAAPKKEESDHLLKSDISLNDPKDPNTQEKLKKVLSMGAFSFNPKEKETLEKILSGN